MLDCTCECHPEIGKCGECCFKHKLIENAKRENAALYERIGVLGECLHVMSQNLTGIEKIRSITTGFHERVSDIEEKITKLKEAYHADAQVCKDIIFDGARRSDEIKEIKEHHNLLSQAVAVIQEWQKSEIEKNISDRIDGLETEINIVRALGSRAFHPKRPHKCPVCEGNCMRSNPFLGIENAKMPVNLDCIVCEGKGIVWG